MRTAVKPNRFVILNAPRTGRNYLCPLLNSHFDELSAFLNGTSLRAELRSIQD